MSQTDIVIPALLAGLKGWVSSWSGGGDSMMVFEWLGRGEQGLQKDDK